jgi:1,4-alpha-glucan branching enzyme
MEKPAISEKDIWLEPFKDVILRRKNLILKKKASFRKNLADFSIGHLYFGLHKIDNHWVLREWAPNATAIYLTGTFNNWKQMESFRFHSLPNGVWELSLAEYELQHKDLYKLIMKWDGGSAQRIPAWANRVVQDPESKIFNAQVWNPEERFTWKNKTPDISKTAPLVYEAHIGMATEELRVGSYEEFRMKILPRIKKAGYNTLQLMAIQEHPYYGSFGYHVSNFFAPSSRFGTPDELKELIDVAHGMGLKVIMDLVHSHAVKNELEGLGLYDGSPYQFFHDGPRRNHVAWDSLCFDYGKDEVIHFLLSNIQYWLKEFQFDGFRFDGITSMLYYDHGLNRDFTSYDMYFDGQQDEDAIVYLGLANELVHELDFHAITIAEEMSGYPGLAAKIEEGGLGFDYRMAMGTPDYWIKIIKEKPDEKWNVDEMFYELTRKRIEEKTLGYSESHDQALVGDKTLIFRLLDKEMYYSMSKSSVNLVVDRGIALHKMIRLITFATSGNAYLNFMGNEFGHPEWIDFPREGNNWSYIHARRQWSLAENKDLRYHFLSDFDREMLKLQDDYKILNSPNINSQHSNPNDQVIAFERNNLFFVFNFNPNTSYNDYGLSMPAGIYTPLLSTDNSRFGGQDRIAEDIIYRTVPEKRYAPNHMLKVYLPSRTALVFQRKKPKGIYD